MRSAELIRNLQLAPHPEGGWYRETYRSEESIPAGSLPARYSGARSFATAIYFLLEAGQFSAFHRLASDEAWFHHAGGDLEIFCIDEAGSLSVLRLGSGAGRWQAFIPRGAWFASRPVDGSDFSLVSCVVAPGFSFDDFELGSRAALVEQYPQHAALIHALTRG